MYKLWRYAMSETSAEIRERRMREFEAGLMTGKPIIPVETVLPWYMNKIEELKADLKKSRASNFKLISELAESEEQIRKLQQEVQTQEDTIIELGEMDEY
jgi:hypothetical protein